MKKTTLHLRTLLSICSTSILFRITACIAPDSKSDAPVSTQSENSGQAQKSTAPKALDPSISQSRSFSDAPQLAERVRSGDLPRVSERLPERPLVVVPIKEIGTYGGVIRRGLLSDISQWPGQMKAMSENLLAFSRPMGESIGPNPAESWEYQDEGRVAVFRLRRGVRWSDGHPFTANDVMFFYEDMLFDENARASDRPTPHPTFSRTGSRSNSRSWMTIPFGSFPQSRWGVY